MDPVQATSFADISSLLLSAAALVVAVVAWTRSDRNTSAGTLVTLNEAFREAWQRYLPAEANKDFEFANLANLIEIGCAIHFDRSVHGASAEILANYLNSVLGLIEETPDARERLKALREEPDNFKYIVRFLAKSRMEHGRFAR